MNTQEELEQLIESYNEYDPKSLAWKLLMDDVKGIDNVIMGFSPDRIQDPDPSSYLFEIYISIFIEMLIGSALIDHEFDNSNIKNQKEFKFNPKKVNFKPYFELIREKMKHIRILSTVSEYTINSNNSEIINEIAQNRYCRIVFKDDNKFKNFFEQNNIDEKYHIIGNEYYIKKNKLRDIYCIIIVDDILYQVRFDNF